MVGQQCEMSLKFNSKDWLLQFSPQLLLYQSCCLLSPPSVVPQPHPRPALHHLKATEEKPLPASSCLLCQGAISHEWLLQCGHGTSCHMGDLISVRLGRNQLPPKTGREHDDYRFSLITVLISKVAAHCEGPLLSILVQTAQKVSKEQNGAGNDPPQSVQSRRKWYDCLTAWLLGWLGSIFRANVWLQVSVFHYSQVTYCK